MLSMLLLVLTSVLLFVGNGKEKPVHGPQRDRTGFCGRVSPCSRCFTCQVNSFCSSPTTTKRNPTSISSTSMARNDAPVTMLLAMLVVILVTLAAGQMEATV